eukprot:scaffold10285_cov74-Cyclotella_meneghiniana.AAC.6
MQEEQNAFVLTSYPSSVRYIRDIVSITPFESTQKAIAAEFEAAAVNITGGRTARSRPKHPPHPAVYACE